MWGKGTMKGINSETGANMISAKIKARENLRRTQWSVKRRAREGGTEQ